MNRANDACSPESLASCIRDQLIEAIAAGREILIATRGNAAGGLGSRVLRGIPISFGLSHGGKERIVLAAVDGDTEQWLLVERVARVMSLNQPSQSGSIPIASDR